jgi:hypothetical protein
MTHEKGKIEIDIPAEIKAQIRNPYNAAFRTTFWKGCEAMYKLIKANRDIKLPSDAKR